MAPATAGTPTPSVPFVDLTAQYDSLAAELEETSRRVLRSTDYILGHELGLFEEEFAAFCATGHAVGVDSGTSALELALRAYGIGVGDQVITAANTFIATALAISYTGATPVLVDADPQTYTLDVSRLEEAVTSRTRAIIPVHLYGQPADMDPILEVAGRHGLRVIEDACQAHGATYRGRPAGSLGDAAAFSFYPAKNLGACGDGGMVVTDDARVADSIRMLRNYGQREKYQHLVHGFNRRLDTLQAALLRVKLRHLDGWNAARRRHARLYSQLLAGSAVETPLEAGYARSVWHLYVVRCHDRAALRARLGERGIATGIHYPRPIHLQPAYCELGYARGDFPVAERQAEQILSLPMYPELGADLVERVAAAVAELAGRAGASLEAAGVGSGGRPGPAWPLDSVRR
jgi:dTDP-4-amino-4,6-dideoxygalactose transaminase